MKRLFNWFIRTPAEIEDAFWESHAHGSNGTHRWIIYRYLRTRNIITETIWVYILVRYETRHRIDS